MTPRMNNSIDSDDQILYKAEEMAFKKVDNGRCNLQ